MKTKILLTALALVGLSTAAKAEGIDCTKATTDIDRVICAHPDIKAQDDTLAKLYAVARVNMFGKGPSGEIALQKKWLASRKQCLPLAEAKRTTCILDLYKSRNLELAFSTMPKPPDLALQVLRDQKIETEPFYEALTIFTSEPDGIDWSTAALAPKRVKIEALLGPMFKTIHDDAAADDPNKHFAIELFDDAEIKNSGDVLKSSGTFAKFFRAATYDKDAILPCGTVVSHQGLLDATNAYFGATPDNFIINSNCETMAPATPKFHALLKQINDHWPQCDGTIRFAAYRQFGVTIDRVLSPSLRAIEDFKPTPAPRPLDGEHKIIGVPKAAITAAENEMAAYYTKYVGASPAKARIFAKAKIADVLYDGQQCE
ncbi:MAG: hypothetical protein KGO94_00615 [Alphaproteobacteria bacterium]|nr:hypothetical protein [Alphaproteobacteria bacterium]